MLAVAAAVPVTSSRSFYQAGFRLLWGSRTYEWSRSHALHCKCNPGPHLMYSDHDPFHMHLHFPLTRFSSLTRYRSLMLRLSWCDLYRSEALREYRATNIIRNLPITVKYAHFSRTLLILLQLYASLCKLNKMVDRSWEMKAVLLVDEQTSQLRRGGCRRGDNRINPFREVWRSNGECQ